MKNREGSYKKELFTPSELKSNSLALKEGVTKLRDLNLGPKEFVTLYLIFFIRLKHQTNWIQNSNKKNFFYDNDENFKILEIIPDFFNLTEWEKSKLKNQTLLSFYHNFNIKSFPKSINRSMIDWILNKTDIIVLEYIPTPKELLALQALNKRCITVVTSSKRIDEFVLNKRDPLSFVLHDLMHADQFFSNEISKKGQLGFYKLIQEIFDLAEIQDLINTNSDFKFEFEYVASDMNAYVIHLFKCFKSSFMKINQEKLFLKILSLWKMNESEIEASIRLNSPLFKLENEIYLKKFFESHSRKST